MASGVLAPPRDMLTMDHDHNSHRRLPSIHNILSPSAPPPPHHASSSPSPYSSNPHRSAFAPPMSSSHSLLQRLPSPPPAAMRYSEAQPHTHQHQHQHHHSHHHNQMRPLPSLANVRDDAPASAHPRTTPGMPPAPLPSVSSVHYTTYPRTTTSPSSYFAERPRPLSPGGSSRIMDATSPGQLDRSPSGTSSPRPPNVARRYMAGHGECYVWPNGHYVPCHINGDPVNPEFGVTKAGKPRKRLAQACMTCREKKIKCQPGEPKCAQCTKLNRECRKPAAQNPSPKGGLSPPEMTPQTFGLTPKPDSPGQMSKKRPHPVYEMLPPPTQDFVSSSSKPASVSSLDTPNESKRQRSFKYEQSPSLLSPAYEYPALKSTQNSQLPSSLGQLPYDPPMNEDEICPYFKDRRTAEELLGLYFVHRDRGPYAVFPKDSFMQWVRNCERKGSDDVMLLYILMAVGSRFSREPRKRSVGKKMARTAACMEQARFGAGSTLQLAQTRLHFLLYHFANGENSEAWEYLSSGVSTCNALGLNTERGIHDVPAGEQHEYGLTRRQIIECRRRTFLAGYVMDRFIGHCGGHMGLLTTDDLILRLPGLEHHYYDGSTDEANSPLFCQGELIRNESTHMGKMASIVPIISAWGKVIAYAYRDYHRSSFPSDKQLYLTRYEQHYRHIYDEVASWEAMLPAELRFSQKNTMQAAEHGYLSEYFVYHAIRFVTLIKLNRNADTHALPAEMMQRNVSQAIKEARSLLSIVSVLNNKISSAPHSEDITNALSQPFPGYCILTACDVLSSGGDARSRSRVRRELDNAYGVLSELGQCWFTAQAQGKKVNQRLKKLGSMDLMADESGAEAGPWRLRYDEDVADFFPAEFDVVYGASEQVFFDAIRDVTV